MGKPASPWLDCGPSHPVFGSPILADTTTTQAPVPAGQNDRPEGYARGVVFVVIAGTAWSIGGVLVRLAEAADAWQILFYRGIFLAIALIPVMLWFSRGRIIEAFRVAGLTAILGGVCLALGNIGFVLALSYTTVANTMFMLAGQPLVSALLAYWLLGESVRRATWVAMVVAGIGIAVMVGNGLAVGRIEGNLLALLSTVAFGAFGVMLRRGRANDMTPTVWYAGVFAALISGLVIVFHAQAGNDNAFGLAAFAVSTRDLALCATMGVVQLAFGLTLFTIGSRSIPAAELMLLGMIEIVLGPIWVWLAVNEVPETLTLVGGAIMLIGIAYQALTGARRKPAPLGP